jgi:hypothetical protein
VKALTDVNGPFPREGDSAAIRATKKDSPEAALLYFEKRFA